MSHEPIYCAINEMPRSTLRTELAGLLRRSQDPTASRPRHCPQGWPADVHLIQSVLRSKPLSDQCDLPVNISKSKDLLIRKLKRSALNYRSEKILRINIAVHGRMPLPRLWLLFSIPMLKLRSCILLLVFFIGGCSSLDRVNQIKTHQLEIGVSSKSDVVNAIGLPRRTEIVKESGHEIWYYTGKPISKSYFVPLPILVTPLSPGLQLINYLDIGSKGVLTDDATVLTCIFDVAGRMIYVKHHEEKQ